MALTLDPSKRNDIIIRQGQSLNFSFLLTNESDGEDFAVAGYTFNLEIYDRRRTKIFDLTDGEGLTVQDGSVAVSISANDLNIPDGDYKYFLVVTNPDAETNTWINGYAKVKDSLSIGSQDDVSVTVSNADNNVNITISIGGGKTLTGEEIKILYESQPDTNAYTDVEKAKVAVIDTNGSSSEFLARDGQYREIDSGGGTGVFEPVQDITELKALDTTDAEEYPDKWAILVEDEGAWYRLDRDSAVSEGLPYIVEPNTGTGRWIQDQHLQLDGKADKATGHTPGNLSELDADGNLVDSGVSATPIDIYNVPQDVKDHLVNDANWTGDTIIISSYTDNGKKGQRYTSFITGYTYECVEDVGVWARYPLNLRTVNILTMLPSEKTKLETSTNWDGVAWKTAANGGQDLNTDSTGKIHFDGTYFYWVIDNNTPIRLTRA